MDDCDGIKKLASMFMWRVNFLYTFQWPVIGWEAESGISHFAEGKIHGTAASIEWAKSMGELDGCIY